MRPHNPNSYIHKASEKVLAHLVDEDGICDHTSVALAAMLGLTEPTVYVVRVHLETCPTAGGYNLPYRAKGPLILTDPDKNLTTLQATAVRALPVMSAASSVLRTLNRMGERNVAGIKALSQEAYASLNTDLGDALDAAATDIQTRGDLHPMTVKALAALGVTL
jgi:hypothetical protein